MKILKHNTDQVSIIKTMDQNVAIFLGSQYAKGPIYQSQHSDMLLRSASVKGPLLEQYWQSKKNNVFLDRMLSTLTGKTIMLVIILSEKQTLLDRTIDMLDYLSQIEKVE